MKLPPIAYISEEADVYPRNHPERADDIDIAIGELSSFHETYGYYAQGVSPKTAILSEGWEQRLIPVSSQNTGGATGLCLDVHDLVLAKYAAGREKDTAFNQALILSGCVSKKALFKLAKSLPVDQEMKRIIMSRIKSDFAIAHPRSVSKSSKP